MQKGFEKITKLSKPQNWQKKRKVSKQVIIIIKSTVTKIKNI
jgi:hypothetical protein